MIRRTPRPKLPGIRAQIVIEPVVQPYTPEDLQLYAEDDMEPVQENITEATGETIEPEDLAMDPRTAATRKVMDRAGRLFLENPMVAGLYTMYESVGHYNQRKSLPVFIRTMPDGTPVHIDYRTLTATP